jgi:trk system potassium uptake protein TrkH
MRSLIAQLRATTLLGNPLRMLLFLFAGLIGVGALVLSLPISRADDAPFDFVTALFTSTSAVCVTGLTVVDTTTYWSGFGQFIIMLLIQLGGLGIVTLATLAFMLLSDRLGLFHMKTLAAETGADSLAGVRGLVRVVVGVTLACEAVIALILTLRFWTAYDMPFDTGLYHGVFHSISAWNNAGFALYSDNMIQFVSDPIISATISIAVILGGIGLPVLRGFWQHRFNTKRWSLHMRLTVLATVVLLAIGFFGFLIFEWTNSKTFGSLSVVDKTNAAFFQSVQPRTAGFNSVNTQELTDESILVTLALMFIGGGSASTAGGVKVATFALLAYVMWAEIRGDNDVTVFKRRVPSTVVRQAITVALAGVGTVAISTLALSMTGDYGLVNSAFEAISALSTVGLSVGVSGADKTLSNIILIALMYIGRLGPITLAAALALRTQPNLFRYPEDRPLIG